MRGSFAALRMTAKNGQRQGPLQVSPLRIPAGAVGFLVLASAPVSVPAGVAYGVWLRGRSRDDGDQLR